jgi:oxygen-dependent protoporphyrinogen oxidase
MFDRQRVAIIGAGISGLAAAHRLRELDPSLDLVLLEASDRVSGVIRTSQEQDFCLEHGPDSFLTQVPWGVDLCRRLGLANDLVPTSLQQQAVYVVCRGRLHALPAGLAIMAPQRLWPIVVSPILSLRGKLRLAGEYFVPPRRQPADESLAQFAARRLGREAFERLVQPLASGIYMGSPDKLSVRATFPRFVEMEEKHGGLIRGARAQRASAKGSATSAWQNGTDGRPLTMFVALRRGMEQLPQAIAARLPAETIHLNRPVQELTRLPEGRWQIVAVAGPDKTHAELFDAVILATSARAAGQLIQAAAPDLSAELRAIDHTSCLVVNLAFRRDQVKHPLDAFGFVSPRIEQRLVTACTFCSSKFAGRAPDGWCLLRAFLGGASQPEVLDWPEERIRRTILAELGELLGVHGEPGLLQIQRWRHTMPQYELGHLERVARIRRMLTDCGGLALAGNAYGGAGIAHCIHSGEQAAEEVVGQLQSNRSCLVARSDA